jgi:hypothetical protein
MAKSELEKQLESLPDNPRAEYKFTMEQDAMLVKFIPTKGYSAVARIMGLDVNRVRRRYGVLQKGMKK